jgi:hypothetical protein
LGGADLRGADLGGADLRGAYLGGAYLRGAYLRDADLRGAYLGDADLGGADLRGAYLRDADLGDADLGDAYLRGAYLRGAKNYSESHDIFFEITRRQKIEIFTEKEWSFIGILSIHRIYWNSIKKQFGKEILRVFEILKEKGWSEYYEKYLVVLGEKSANDWKAIESGI